MHLEHYRYESRTDVFDLLVHSRCDGVWSAEAVDRLPGTPVTGGPVLDATGNALIAYSDYFLREVYLARRAGNTCDSAP